MNLDTVTELDTQLIIKFVENDSSDWKDHVLRMPYSRIQF
jgi:hypothetical protein